MTGVILKSFVQYGDPSSSDTCLAQGHEVCDYSPSVLFASSVDEFPGDEFPTEINNDWTSFNSLSSPCAFFKLEPMDESPILTSISATSPSANTTDLSSPVLPEDVIPFGGDEALVIVENNRLFTYPQPGPAAAAAGHCTELNITAKQMKRKSLSGSSYGSASPSPCSSISPPPPSTLPPRKTAHNMIEKRYRNNLNDKISALRDAVPSLRVMVNRLETNDLPGDERQCPYNQAEEDLGGLTPAHKLNKATILSKATEYINHLERRNRALARENQGLRGKVDGYEMLLMQSADREPRRQQQQSIQQWC